MFWWQIYCAFLVLIVGATLIGRIVLLARYNKGTSYDLVEAVLSAIAVTGICGYVAHRAILLAAFWKVMFVVVAIGWFAHFFGQTPRQAIRKIGMLRALPAIVIGQFVLVPGIVALFRYAFLSPGIWDRAA